MWDAGYENKGCIGYHRVHQLKGLLIRNLIDASQIHISHSLSGFSPISFDNSHQPLIFANLNFSKSGY